MAGERVVFGLRVVNVFLQFTTREAVGSSGQKTTTSSLFIFFASFFSSFFVTY